MGEKFELKHLIRLVFWRKKPHIVTDIGGAVRRYRGVGVSHRRLCVFWGAGVCLGFRSVRKEGGK